MTDPTRPLPDLGAPRSRVQDAPPGRYVPPPGTPDPAATPYPSSPYGPAGGANPYAVGSASGQPTAAPNPYAVHQDPSALGAYAAGHSNGSAITLVALSALCIFPLALITQIPALVLGIMSLAAGRAEPARAARLARAGWWAFAGGLVLIVVLALVMLAALIGLITAFLGLLAG